MFSLVSLTLIDQRNRQHKAICHAITMQHAHVIEQNYILAEDPDRQNAERRTYLHHASEVGSLRWTKYLLDEVYASPHIRDREGLTPRMVAEKQLRQDLAIGFTDEQESYLAIIALLHEAEQARPLQARSRFAVGPFFRHRQAGPLN